MNNDTVKYLFCIKLGALWFRDAESLWGIESDRDRIVIHAGPLSAFLRWREPL